MSVAFQCMKSMSAEVVERRRGIGGISDKVRCGKRASRFLSRGICGVVSVREIDDIPYMIHIWITTGR